MHFVHAPEPSATVRVLSGSTLPVEVFLGSSCNFLPAAFPAKQWGQWKHATPYFELLIATSTSNSESPLQPTTHSRHRNEPCSNIVIARINAHAHSNEGSASQRCGKSQTSHSHAHTITGPLVPPLAVPNTLQDALSHSVHEPEPVFTSSVLIATSTSMPERAR